MRVCDICREKKTVKPYVLPMKEVWNHTYQGEILDSYVKVVDTEVDLCPQCAAKIADLIKKMKEEKND